MGWVESNKIDATVELRALSEITDSSFPEIFESLATGRDSSDRVLRTIIEGLLFGRYNPGERVVARQLAEELDVSIVPVREAIHILAGEGVIELSARKGARIRSLNKEEVGNWWEIQSLPALNPAIKRFQRLMLGYATDLELDGNGRMLLPAPLREYAQLEKKLVLVGQGNKLELWSETLWLAERDKALSESGPEAVLPDELMSLTL